MKVPVLGIIAGDGSLPKQIVDVYSGVGGKCFVAAVARQGNFALNQQSFAIGQAGKILKYFTDNEVENIIIIGGIKRPDLSNLSVDITGAMLLAKIAHKKIRGDDNILRIIAEFLEGKGFRVISAKEILNLQNSEVMVKSYIQPLKKELDDISLGKIVMEALGEVDVGQSVVVHQGYVLGIEAAEGTDNLITRCAALRKKTEGGVLVKMVKSGQDFRLDTPVVGPETIEKLAQHGYAGLAIEANIIIAEPERFLQLLDQHKLFLYMI
ncbi:MAG: hypothetical protein DGJ47_000673 [Rickettsiaceae bacterium]